EASIRNVYDELYLEGPASSSHLALPGRGEVSLPADFVSRMSGTEYGTTSYCEYGYKGGGLGDLLPGETYEPKGLHLSIARLPEVYEVVIHTTSGFVLASDGDGYSVQVDWTYDFETRTLERKVRFLRDVNGSSGIYGAPEIPADDFLAATGLTRAGVEAWAENALDGLVVGGYLGANEGRTRFSAGDIGELAVTDEMDWGSAA
ncbi:hypothetical protein, partial [Olsenella sp. Marseille-P4559]|uniref:hypothetical protein n=1 Tax=Olsenella sp. Marseille-P4559 TaxID=2364795 RepID=UPI0013EEF286